MQMSKCKLATLIFSICIPVDCVLSRPPSRGVKKCPHGRSTENRRQTYQMWMKDLLKVTVSQTSSDLNNVGGFVARTMHIQTLTTERSSWRYTGGRKRAAPSTSPPTTDCAPKKHGSSSTSNAYVIRFRSSWTLHTCLHLHRVRSTPPQPIRRLRMCRRPSSIIRRSYTAICLSKIIN